MKLKLLTCCSESVKLEIMAAWHIPLVFVFFFSFCGSENYFWKRTEITYNNRNGSPIIHIIRAKVCAFPQGEGGYSVMCVPKGYGFSAILAINRVSILDLGILVINRESIFAF